MAELGVLDVTGLGHPVISALDLPTPLPNPAFHTTQPALPRQTKLPVNPAGSRPFHTIKSKLASLLPSHRAADPTDCVSAHLDSLVFFSYSCGPYPPAPCSPRGYSSPPSRTQLWKCPE